jgi:CNT family concentrative nucleoside transporter
MINNIQVLILKAFNLSFFEQNKEIILSQGFSLESLFRGLIGMSVLIFVAFLLSNNRKAINWKTASFGLILQIILAVAVLKISWVKLMFEYAGKIFVKILDFTMEGTKFLFGDLVSLDNFGNVFIFSILPTVIFFAALTSILFYFGIIQKVVKLMAIILSKVLGVSGPESLSVAGNIFLGQTESPLMIKAYLEKMSKSEILLVMIGGMATVAGGVLAAYIGFLGGDDPELKIFYAKHLLTASVMAAPGAIVISKILYPETSTVNTDLKIPRDKIGSNFLEAISNGTSEGLKLAANIAAMLLVFLAFIAMINYMLDGLGSILYINELISNHSVYDKLSLEFLLGYLFSPIMWLIGVASEDVTLMGQLLGIKLAASEFIGYIQLSSLKDVTSAVHLNYQKSIIMATYMLCGFANFASIGIQIGGIGALEPKQRKNLSKFGFLAVVGGTLASLLSATIAGMIIG